MLVVGNNNAPCDNVDGIWKNKIRGKSVFVSVWFSHAPLVRGIGNVREAKEQRTSHVQIAFFLSKLIETSSVW